MQGMQKTDRPIKTETYTPTTTTPDEQKQILILLGLVRSEVRRESMGENQTENIYRWD